MKTLSNRLKMVFQTIIYILILLAIPATVTAQPKNGPEKERKKKPKKELKKEPFNGRIFFGFSYNTSNLTDLTTSLRYKIPDSTLQINQPKASFGIYSGLGAVFFRNHRVEIELGLTLRGQGFSLSSLETIVDKVKNTEVDINLVGIASLRILNGLRLLGGLSIDQDLYKKTEAFDANDELVAEDTWIKKPSIEILCGIKYNLGPQFDLEMRYMFNLSNLGENGLKDSKEGNFKMDLPVGELRLGIVFYPFHTDY